jgi:hypothetical protein
MDRENCLGSQRTSHENIERTEIGSVTKAPRKAGHDRFAGTTRVADCIDGDLKFEDARPSDGLDNRLQVWALQPKIDNLPAPIVEEQRYSAVLDVQWIADEAELVRTHFLLLAVT